MYKLTIKNYLITEDGEVINTINNKILKPTLNNKGYKRVCIGGCKKFVHRLVAEKFVPNPENKPQVNHKDGNKLNNNYTNLEWVTNQENRNHAIKNSLHLCGEKCSWSKLKESDVIFIRKSILSNNELAKKFNVSVRTIRDIKKYKSWKTVEKIC